MIARSSMKIVLRKAPDAPESSLPEQIAAHVSKTPEYKIPPYANPTYMNTSTEWPSDAVALPKTKSNQTYRDFRIERQLREDHASITAGVMRQHGLQVPHKGIVDLLRIGHNTAATGMPYLSPPATTETAHSPRPLAPAEEGDYHPQSLYHGTTSNFRDIDPKMMLRAQSEAGFYLGDKWTAEHYSRKKKGTDKPVVKEYRLPLNMKIFDFDEGDTPLKAQQKSSLQDLITKIAKYHGIDINEKLEQMDYSSQNHLLSMLTHRVNQRSYGEYDPPEDLGSLTIANIIAHADRGHRGYHDTNGELQFDTKDSDDGTPLRGGLTAVHVHNMAKKFVEFIRSNLHNNPSNKYYVGTQDANASGDTKHLFPSIYDYGFPHGHDMQSHFLSVLGYDGATPSSGWRVIFPHATHKLRCVGEEIQKSFRSQMTILYKSEFEQPVASITHPHEIIDRMANTFNSSTKTNPYFFMTRESHALEKATHASASSAMRRSHAAIASKYFPPALQAGLTGPAGRDIGRLGHISHPDVPSEMAYKGPAVSSPLTAQEEGEYHAPRLFHGSKGSASTSSLIDPKYFFTSYIGTGLYTTTDKNTAERYAGFTTHGSPKGHVREYAIPKSMKILDDRFIDEPMNSEQHEKIVKFLQEIARFHGVDPEKRYETKGFEDSTDPVMPDIVRMWSKTGPYDAKSYKIRRVRPVQVSDTGVRESIPPKLSFSDVLRTTDWRHGELEKLARYAKEFITIASKNKKTKEYTDRALQDPTAGTSALEGGRSMVSSAMDRANDFMALDLWAHMASILGYDGSWNGIDDYMPGVYRGDDPDAPEAKLPWHVPAPLTSDSMYHAPESYSAGVRGHMVLFPHAANKARLVGVHSSDMADEVDKTEKSLRKSETPEAVPPVKSPYDMLAEFGERVSKPTPEIDKWKNPYVDAEKKDRVNAYLSSLQMLPGMRSAHAAIARRYFPESLQQDLAFTPGRDFARLGHVSDPIAPAGQSPYRAAAVASPLSLAEQGDYHQPSLFHGSKAPLGTAGQIDPKLFSLATLGTGLYMTTQSRTAHRYAGATGHVREYVIPKTLNILDDREIGNRVSTDQKTRIINFLRDVAKMHGFDPDKMLAMRPHSLLTPTGKAVRRLCERFGSWDKRDRARNPLGGGRNPISVRDPELLLPDEHSMTSILRGIDIRPHDLANLAYYVKDILEASLFYDPDNTHKKTIDRLSNASGKSSAAVLGANPFMLSRSQIWSDMYAHMAAILGYDGIWNHSQDGGLGAYRGADFDSPESKIPWHTAPSTAGDSPVSGIMLLMPHAANKARLVGVHSSDTPKPEMSKSLRKAEAMGTSLFPVTHPYEQIKGLHKELTTTNPEVAAWKNPYQQDRSSEALKSKYLGLSFPSRIRRAHAAIARRYFPDSVMRDMEGTPGRDFGRLGHVSEGSSTPQSPYKSASVPSWIPDEERQHYHHNIWLYHGSKGSADTTRDIDPKYFRHSVAGTGLYLTTSDLTAKQYASQSDTEGHIRAYVLPKTMKILDDRALQRRLNLHQKTKVINFLKDVARMHGFDPDKTHAYDPYDSETGKALGALWRSLGRRNEGRGIGLPPKTFRSFEKHSLSSILHGINMRPFDLPHIALHFSEIIDASMEHDPDNAHREIIDDLKEKAGIDLPTSRQTKIYEDIYAHMVAMLGYDGIWHGQNSRYSIGSYSGIDMTSPDAWRPWHVPPSQTDADDTESRDDAQSVKGMMLLMPHAVNKARLVHVRRIPSEYPIGKSLRKAGDVEAPQEHPLAAQIGELYHNDSKFPKYHYRIAGKIRNIHALIAKDFFPPDVRRRLNARQVQDIARIGHESDPKAPTIAPYEGAAVPKPLSPEEIDMYHPQSTGAPTETPSNGFSLYHGTPLQSTEMAEFDPKHATGGLAGTGFYLSNTYQMARQYTRRRGQRTPEDKYGHIREYVAPKSLKMLTSPEMWTPAHGAARERVIKYAQTILRAHGFDLNHQYDLNTSSNTYGMNAEDQKKEAFRQHILKSLNNDARYGAASKYLPKELDRKNPKISIAELLQAYGNHDQNIDHYINSLGVMLASLASFSPNNHHSSYAERENTERLMQQDFQAHIGSILGYDGIWRGEFRDVIPWHLDPTKDAYGFIFPHAASQMRLVGIHEMPENLVQKSFSKSLPEMPSAPAYVGLHEKEIPPHVVDPEYYDSSPKLVYAMNAMRQEHAALAARVINPEKAGPVGLRNLAGLGSTSLGKLLPSESAAPSVPKPAPVPNGGSFSPTRLFHGTTAPPSWLDEIHPGLTRIAVLGQGFYLSPYMGHASTYAKKNKATGHIREYRMPSDLTILHTERKIHDTVPDPEKMRSFVQSLFEHHGIDIDKKHEIESWKTESLIEGIKLAISGHKNSKSLLKETLGKQHVTYRDFLNLLGTNAHLSGKFKNLDGNVYQSPPLHLSVQMMSMIRENLLHDRSNRHALNALQQGPEAFDRFSQDIEDVLRPSNNRRAVQDLSSHMAATAGYDGYFTGKSHELYGILGMAKPQFMAHGGALTIYPHAVHRLMHVRNHEVARRPEQAGQASTAFERAKEMFGQVFARKSLTETFTKSLPDIPYFEGYDSYDHQVRKIMHAHAEIARRHLPAVTTEGSRDLLRIGHVSDPSTPTATPYTGPAIPMPLTPHETGSYLDLPVFHGTSASPTQMATHDPKRNAWSTGMFATTRKDIANTYGYGRGKRNPDYHIREYRIPKSLQYVRVSDFADQSSESVIDPVARKRLVDFLTSLAKFHGVDPDKSLSLFNPPSATAQKGLSSIRSMAENLTSPIDFTFSNLFLKKIKTNILDDPSNDHAKKTIKNRIASLLDNPIDDQLAEHIAAVLGYDGYHLPYSKNESTGKNIEAQKGVYVTFPHALHKLRLVGIHQEEEPSLEKSLGDPAPTGANEEIAQHLARPRTVPAYMDPAYSGYTRASGTLPPSERLIQQLREDHAAIAAPFLQKRNDMPSSGVAHLLRIGHGTESTGIPLLNPGARNLPKDQYHEFPVYHGTTVSPENFSQIDPSLFNGSSYATGFYVSPDKYLADVYARSAELFKTDPHVREYLVPKKLNLFFHDDHRTSNRILPIPENADTSFDHKKLKNAVDFLLEIAKFHGLDPDKPFDAMGQRSYLALRELLQRGEVDSQDKDQTLRSGFAKIQTPNQLFSISMHLWDQLRYGGANRPAIRSVASDSRLPLRSDLISHALSIAGYDGYADGTGPHLHDQSIVSIFPHAVHTLVHSRNIPLMETELGKALGTGSPIEPTSPHNQEIHPIVNPEYSFDRIVKEHTTGVSEPGNDGRRTSDMLNRLGRQMQESVARIAAHSLLASRGISPEGFVSTLRLGHETPTPDDALWQPKPASSPSKVPELKERQYYRLPLFHGTSASRHSFGSIDSKKLLYGALGPGVYLTPDLSMASDFVDHNIRGKAASAGSIRRYRIPRDFKLFDYNKHLQLFSGVPEVSEFAPKTKENILGFLQKLAEFHGVDIDKKYNYNDTDELAPHIIKFIKKITNYDIPKDTENKYNGYSYGMRKEGLIDDKYDGKTITLRDILSSQLRNASDLYSHSDLIKHLLLQDIANNTDNKLNKQFSHDASGKSLAAIKVKDTSGKKISLLEAKRNFIQQHGVYSMGLDLRGHLLALAGYDGVHTGVNFDPLPQDDVHPGSLSRQEKLEHWTNPKSHNRTEMTIFPHAIHRLVYTGTPRKLKKSGLQKALPESLPSMPSLPPMPSEARTHEMLQVPATVDPHYEVPLYAQPLDAMQSFQSHAGRRSVTSQFVRMRRQELEQISRLLGSTLAKRSPHISSTSLRDLMRIGHSTHEQDASIGSHEREIPQESPSGAMPFYHGTTVSSNEYARPDPAFMQTGIDGLGLYLTPKFDLARTYADSASANGLRFKNDGTPIIGHVREYTIPASLKLAPTAPNGHADRDNYISKQEHLDGLYDFFSKLSKFYGIDPNKKFDANFKTDESNDPTDIISAKSDLNRDMAAVFHSFQKLAKEPSTSFTLRDLFDFKKYSPAPYALTNLIQLTRSMSKNLMYDPENIHHDMFRRDKNGKLLSDEELKEKQKLYEENDDLALFKDTMWGHMLASMGYDGAAHKDRVVILPHAINKLNLERIHSI